MLRLLSDSFGTIELLLFARCARYIYDFSTGGDSELKERVGFSVDLRRNQWVTTVKSKTWKSRSRRQVNIVVVKYSTWDLCRIPLRKRTHFALYFYWSIVKVLSTFTSTTPSRQHK
ncbi:30955_t:CDS:2, partial [Racocetra persica]